MLSGRGRSCQSGGRRWKERRAQQRALTTAGDFFFFFLQLAFSQHLSWIFFPPAERQKRVGPRSCSRYSSDSSSGCSINESNRRSSNAPSLLEVIASKPCWVAGCDRTPAGRRTEPCSRILRPHCLAFPLRHGLTRGPPRLTLPGSGQGLRAAAASGRGGSQTPSPWNSETRGRCVSHPLFPAADCVPKTFAGGSRRPLQPVIEGLYRLYLSDTFAGPACPGAS